MIVATRLAVVAILAGISVMLGCGERPPDAPSSPPDPPPVIPVALAQKDDAWGGVKGTVVWGEVEIPKRAEIQSVNQNQDKNHCLEKGPLLSEQWVVNERNKGLRWTFVWLAPEPDSGKKDLPIHAKLQKIQGQVVIDQPLCMFFPHSLGIREGQTLLVKNPAPVAHNFKWGGHPDFNPGGNTLMPPNTDLTIKKLKAHRTPIKMECNIHPWMNGWIRVFDHPYFAVTDENGAFEIKDAPASKLRLVVWHGSGGFLGGAAGREGRSIVIESGKTTDIGALAFSPPK
jgi:hypothetical protein